jgi:hypothetical protein
MNPKNNHNHNPNKNHHKRGERSAHLICDSTSPRRKSKWRSMERNMFRYGDIATSLITRLSKGLRVIMEQADFEII